MVAQEDRPLAIVGNLRRLAQDIRDGMAILLGDRHIHARHEREVVAHVAFVAAAEISGNILGPLIGLGDQNAIGIMRLDRGADLADDVMGLRQVLAIRARSLDQIGNGVEGAAHHPGIRANSAAR